MTDLLADYTEYSSDTRAASVYRTWKRQNPGEARQWETFDTELKAGNRPAPPTLKTSYGQSLVGAGVIYLHATETPAQPTPPGPVPEQYGQLGLYQLADSLEAQTHLTDGTYTGPIIADWHDGNFPLIHNQGYIYTQAPVGTPGGNIDLTQPQAFLDKYLPLAAQTKAIGLFVDNVQPSVGPNMVTFLQYVYPKVHQAGYKLGGNVSISGSPHSDADSDGRSWVANVKTYAPYLDLVMLEGWQECLYGPASAGIPCKRLRGTDYYQCWDGWQQALTDAQPFTQLM